MSINLTKNGIFIDFDFDRAARGFEAKAKLRNDGNNTAAQNTAATNSELKRDERKESNGNLPKGDRGNLLYVVA